MTIVQSLWVGNDLSPLEQYCIKSFLNAGHEFHLYIYGTIGGIPEGTTIKDGNEIMPEKQIFQLKKTFLPFSDIFRYKMLYEKGNYWVDMDMICIKKLDFKEPYIFSSERTIQKGAYAMKVKYTPNIGILKAPKKSEFYKTLYEKCIELEKKSKNKDKIKYMRVLREHIKNYKYEKYVKKPELFCHLDWWYAKDAFLSLKNYRPKYGVAGKTIRSMFHGPYTIHLWRDLITKKYQIDINDIHPKDSLWELMKIFVDTKQIPLRKSHKSQLTTKQKTKKKQKIKNKK